MNMVARDATKLAPNEYFFGQNIRTRYNEVTPIKLPLEITDPVFPIGGNFQGVYGAGSYLAVFIDGEAYVRNFSVPNSSFFKVAGLLLTPAAPQIWAELVPLSTMDLKRIPKTVNKNDGVNLTSSINSLPAALVVQDGIKQPWLIFANGTAREAAKYSDWTDANREYVPIGTMMLYNDGILYIVSPDGKELFRSVTGRPLDFMVNIDAAGNKLATELDGGASSVSYKIDFDSITSLNRIGGKEGGFFLSTSKSSYLVQPSFNVTIFNEPTFINSFLFTTGPLNPFSLVEVLGDTVFIDIGGVRSFNAIAQFQIEGANSPFSAKVSPLFRGITQSLTASITFDNYALFGVTTTFGGGVLVYDMLLERFVSLDRYFPLAPTTLIQQFAELKIGATHRVFFITSDNKLFEAFAGLTAEAQIILGEFASKNPRIEQNPSYLNLVFSDSEEAGTVYATAYVDRILSLTLSDTVPASFVNTSPLILPFGTYTDDSSQNIAFNFGRAAQGWKAGFLVKWAFQANLTYARYEARELTKINPLGQQVKAYAAS